MSGRPSLLISPMATPPPLYILRKRKLFSSLPSSTLLLKSMPVPVCSSKRGAAFCSWWLQEARSRRRGRKGASVRRWLMIDMLAKKKGHIKYDLSQMYESKQLIVRTLQIRDEVGVNAEIRIRYGEHVVVPIVCRFEAPGGLPHAKTDEVGTAQAFPIELAATFCQQGIGGVDAVGIVEGHGGQRCGATGDPQFVDERERTSVIGRALTHQGFGGHQQNVGLAEKDKIVTGNLVRLGACGEVRGVFNDPVAYVLEIGEQGYVDAGRNFRGISEYQGKFFSILQGVAMFVVLLVDQDPGSDAAYIGNTGIVCFPEAVIEAGV